MHVAAVVTPPCRLIVERFFNHMVQAVPHLHHLFRREPSTFFLKQLVSAVLIAVKENGVVHQPVEDVCRASCVVIIQIVGVQVDEYDLAVPADEPETLVTRNPIAESHPVVVVPVGVAPILVNQHIVDEVVNIKQFLHFRVFIARVVASRQLKIGGVGVCRFLHHQQHLVPFVDRAVSSLHAVGRVVLLHLDHVVVSFVSTEIRGTIVAVNTLRHII